jgi:pyruvate,water dikinase
MRVRKYTGQPASPGIGVGNSRVIKTIDDIFTFQHGEVLVCDSIDPNITFIVPFASAIIERRGGMLIHGAIIAREYGIPCVTGIEKATQLIKNGSSVVVDGYLGIVTIKEE